MKTYLGDAVYFDFDGYHVVLTTEDGIQATNRILLEPQVILAMLKKIDGIEHLKIWLEKNR